MKYSVKPGALNLPGLYSKRYLFKAGSRIKAEIGNAHCDHNTNAKPIKTHNTPHQDFHPWVCHQYHQPERKALMRHLHMLNPKVI